MYLLFIYFRPVPHDDGAPL